MDYEKAKKAFENYMDSYDRKNKQIHLKYVHTYKVVELMAELAFRLGLDKDQLELAKIIGLLHDIGRFEQIKQYGTISDRKTNMDHADYGCHYLLDDHHIRDFGINEDTKEAQIIYSAIKNHNKLEIEDGLSEDELLFAKMIRDMDKVDIFRVIAVEYEMKFDADEISSEILKKYSNHQQIDTKLLKNASDQTLLYLNFINDINFNESYDILVETDNFDLFLGVIEVNENSEKLWKKLKEISFDQINKGIKSNI